MHTDFFKGKKTLVTGGSGFVGSHIVEALLKIDASIRVTVHRSPLEYKNSNIETIKADLCRLEDCVKAVKGVDYVFHAAGSVGAAAITADKTMDMITTNLTLTALMLQAAWSVGVKRFLLFGSSTAYPEADYPIKEKEMWNAPPYSGYFGYGWMRRYLERLAEFVHKQSDMKVAIVRPTAIYGRRDNFNPMNSHVIPGLIYRAAAKENPFIVWGEKNVIRDFLHVTDLASGCLSIIENHAECDPVNIGYGRAISIKEVVDIVLEAAGNKNAEVIFDTTKPTAIPIRMVDTSKAKKLLNFEPKISIAAGIRDTCAWYINTRKDKQGSHE